jgi:hypothetical protein
MKIRRPRNWNGPYGLRSRRELIRARPIRFWRAEDLSYNPAPARTGAMTPGCGNRL